jgi:hypothetical protein
LALEVPLTPSQRWELTFQLARLARIEQDLAQAEQQMEKRLAPH